VYVVALHLHNITPRQLVPSETTVGNSLPFLWTHQGMAGADRPASPVCGGNVLSTSVLITVTYSNIHKPPAFEIISFRNCTSLNPVAKIGFKSDLQALHLQLI
jgi:hypothetical protein